jgi:propanol-preferring alcohol dehydrogenase
VGDRVGVAWLRHTDGGYAEYTTVPAAFAHRLPPDVADVELAPLLCAGITGYRALFDVDPPHRAALRRALA